MRRAAQTGVSRTWYSTDALGSVRQTLSDSGAVLYQVQYDPWGTLEAGASAPFGFTGELSDGGLFNLRARWYNASNGSFTARDSFEGILSDPQSVHPYTYTHNNPVNYTDPSGAFRCSLSTGIVAAESYATSFAPTPGGAAQEVYDYAELCNQSYKSADEWLAKGRGVDALGVLVRLFAERNFPGGTGSVAASLRQGNLTSAAERLEFVLDYTNESFTNTPFGKAFGQSGLNAQFQDPWIGQSDNQVAHFLTAVVLAYDGTAPLRKFRLAAWAAASLPWNTMLDPCEISDEELAIRLTVGHEKIGDSPYTDFRKTGDNAIRAVQQYAAANDWDVESFYAAVDADAAGNAHLRDQWLRQIIPGLPDSIDPAQFPGRVGNSLQDLRLSVKGWRFGSMIKRKELTTFTEAATWLQQNLR